jgi:peptidoglycan/xylan/chitin deacetylase (PgdA/CDA1 family)
MKPLALPLLLVWLIALTAAQAGPENVERQAGGIVRGPRHERKIALEFSADEFTEGAPVILDQLAARHIKASFFLTGRCLRNPRNDALVRRIVAGGHFLGPHSDTHPLLCPWTGPKKTLVTKEFFTNELERNIQAIESYGVKRTSIRYFIPPYEWYNEEIAQWAGEQNLTLINFTSGTRANADYTEDGARNFVSSEKILASIKAREKQDGLNGWLLLLHLGVGPRRADKMSDHLGELLDYLQGTGYQFVRVDELLNPRGKQ